MSDPTSLNVAAELAGLRGEMATGFARIEGAITTLTQSINRTQTDLEELEEDLDKLSGRVSALEARRWPLGVMAALSGVVSAAVAALAFAVQL